MACQVLNRFGIYRCMNEIGNVSMPQLMGCYFKVQTVNHFSVMSSLFSQDRCDSMLYSFSIFIPIIAPFLDSSRNNILPQITPALGEGCREMILTCLKIARKKGLTVSFDGNFRSTLWTWEEARDFCTRCVPYVDVLLGIEPYHLWKDEKDHSLGDVKDGLPMQPDFEQQERVFEEFVRRYPNLKCIARHVRYAHNGSENSLKAYMWYQGRTYESRMFTFQILDRVGGGDAFASGLIYAMMKDYEPTDMVNFAVASSAIKHTIHGDGNITDDADTIRSLMDMSFDIKR